MATKTVYQTLENRGKPSDIVKNGPYDCKWENSWLGDGFYFWDTFIDNAHWWGKEIRKYTNGYIICQAICDIDFNEDKCCDLLGNTEHIQMFKNAYELLRSEGIANETTTVKRLITFLKDSGLFNYEAVRASGTKSRKPTSPYNFHLDFEANRSAYLELTPPIQICFYHNKSLNLRDYKITYPQEYIPGNVV